MNILLIGSTTARCLAHCEFATELKGCGQDAHARCEVGQRDDVLPPFVSEQFLSILILGSDVSNCARADSDWKTARNQDAKHFYSKF